MTTKHFLAYCILLGFGVLSISGCQANIRDYVRRLQKENPQGCMQCGELKLSKLCESSALSKSKAKTTCGKSSINYHMIFTKQNCGRAVVHCSSRFPKLDSVVVAIENPLLNLTSGNSSEMEINTSVFVEELQKNDFLDDEPDNFLYISPQKKTSTSTTLICNNEAKWEATTNDGKLITGITEVHCIVGKPTS
ncbi:hypothetical protein FO519_007504 [Halicephalobus sp. NKZ332]|nr:hypothetical protein FO519_007504 [Halicephalobus sp. NKZ332]